MRILETFECEVYEEEELLKRETTEIMVLITHDRSLIEIGQLEKDMTGEEKTKHARSVFHGFQEEWIGQIVETLSNWLKSNRTPHISQTLGEAEVVTDHTTDERERGELSFSVGKRGIYFIFNTVGNDIYEYKIPAGTRKFANEYESFDNIESLRDVFDDFLLTQATNSQKTLTESTENPHSVLRRIFSNFPHSIKPLKDRRNDADSIEISDEYALQDVIESHLRAFFDDVRREESVLSRRGANSAIDFLLKQEKIAIELKKTRDGLEEKELVEEIITDIERYQEHPDCEILYFFIYDPKFRVTNPSQVEELEESGDIPIKIERRPE